MLREIDEIKPIPEPSLKRLPTYLQLLKVFESEGLSGISTTSFANELSLDPTQVRKDLGYTGIIGKPKVGYDVKELITTIESFLNWDNNSDAFLAGAGNLGSALVGYKTLKEHGVNIVACFDSDENKIGKTIKGVSVFDIKKLPNLAKRMHIKIGIITVSEENAQSVADLMINSGIKAIWNFTPAAIKVKEDVIIENADFTPSLALLTRKIYERKLNTIRRD